MISPGKQLIKTFDLHKETIATFTDVVGKSAHYIRLSASFTNICHIPSIYVDGVYYMVLTRVDDFRVRIGNHWFARKDGIILESHDGAIYKIQMAAAKLLAD